MTHVERLAIRGAVFLSGAMLMATEIAAFRIIGKSFGSALRETTAVIAVFLAAMSIGYWPEGERATSGRVHRRSSPHCCAPLSRFSRFPGSTRRQPMPSRVRLCRSLSSSVPTLSLRMAGRAPRAISTSGSVPIM